MRKNILAFFVALIAVVPVFAQGSQTSDILKNKVNTITTAVPFLMIAPDARSGALGDAGVSSSPDANSMHWNPSKYAFIDKDFGVSVSYSPWLRGLVNDINLAYLGVYKRINERQTLAASLLYFSLGNITFTDEIGSTIGSFKPNEFAVDAAYTYKFSDNFSGGIALRYIYSNLTGGIYVAGAASKAGQTGAADVSVYYQKPFKMGKMASKFAFGANISNIGAKISYTENLERDFIPINLRIGPSFLMNFDKFNSLAVMVDFNKLLVPSPPVYQLDSTGKYMYDVNGNKIIAQGKDPNVPIVTGMLQSFYDAPGGFSEELKEITYSVGLEYWYDKQFSVRGGYFAEHATKGNRKYFTLGAGLRYSVFGLDFAYLIPIEQRNPLENTLRFTLLFNFDAVKGNNNGDGEKKGKKSKD
ncbi:MAG: type IX secretion system outer membrane channel protein PorV [Bacteroidota bacterium]